MSGKAIRETVGLLAVVASLVFVAAEVRQNTDALVAASSTDLTNQSLDFFSVGLDNQIVARALYKQGIGEALDGFETAQLVRLQYMNFRIFENAFLQYQRGHYDPDEWDRYRRIITRNFRDLPIVKEMWEQFRGEGFTDDFEREVDGLDPTG